MTTITAEQWAALEAAEAPLYRGEYGAHSYTSVNPDRDHDQLVAELWLNAELNVSAMSDDGEATTEQVAQRVAVTLACLAFGPGWLEGKA